MITKSGYFIINGNMVDASSGVVSYPESATVEEFDTLEALKAEAILRGIYQEPEEIVLPKIVPEFITIRQAQLRLYDMELWDTVQQMAEANGRLKIEMSTASFYYRNSPVLNEFANSLNLTQEQIDDFFIEAKKL